MMWSVVSSSPFHGSSQSQQPFTDETDMLGQQPWPRRGATGADLTARRRLLLLLGFSLCCSISPTRAFLLLPHSSTMGCRAQHATGPLRAAGAGDADGGGKGPIQVTPEMIKHTATLAQLSFDDAEIAALVPRFQAFLGFVEKMREVPDDAPGMTPAALPEAEAVLRADEPAAFGNQDAIFANMPAQEEGCLSVPKVGEEDT